MPGGVYLCFAWVRMQRVQTMACCGRPCTRTVAFCRLGMKRRFVCSLEWLTLLPAIGPLPQRSHLLDISIFPYRLIACLPCCWFYSFGKFPGHLCHFVFFPLFTLPPDHCSWSWDCLYASAGSCPGCGAISCFLYPRSGRGLPSALPRPVVMDVIPRLVAHKATDCLYYLTGLPNCSIYQARAGHRAGTAVRMVGTQPGGVPLLDGSDAACHRWKGL